MGNTIEEEIIKYKKPVHINNLVLIVEFIMVTFLLIAFFYSYTDYYETIGVVEEINNNYYLKFSIPQKKYLILSNNLDILIENKPYSYEIYEFDSNLYIDSNMNNYRYLYLKVDLLEEYKITNYLLNIKVPIRKQTIIKYLQKIIGGN